MSDGSEAKHTLVNVASKTDLTVSHSGKIYDLRVSPDGKWLASASGDKTVGIFDLVNNKAAKVATGWLSKSGHSEDVANLAWNAKSDVLASASSDKHVKFWSLEAKDGTWKCTGGVKLGGVANGLAWKPDGTGIIATSMDGKATYFSYPELKVVKEFTAHGDGVENVAWLADGSLFATSALNGEIIIWESSQNSQAKMPWKAHRSGCPALRYSPDGKYLASGGSDATLRLWGTDNLAYNEVAAVPLAVAASERVLARRVAWSPDSAYVAVGVGGSGKTLSIIGVAAKAIVDTIAADVPGPGAVDWSGDGKTIYVAVGKAVSAYPLV